MLQYIVGDATCPQGEGNKMILHICNDIGGWGRGFVVALSTRWKAPEEKYLAWAAHGTDFSLGRVQFVQVTKEITVANMIAQHDIVAQGGVPPIRYQALEQCLTRVAARAKAESFSIHMPRIGSGLAGGDWERIEGMIQKNLVEKGLSVTVYDLE